MDQALETLLEQQDSKIAILGAGSWGTALSLYLSRKSYPVSLWHHDPLTASTIELDRQNKKFLPDIYFPENLHCTSDLLSCISGARIILIVVPSQAFFSIIQKLNAYLQANQIVLWATKGFDPDSHDLLHTVAKKNLPLNTVLGLISGPNFATEVAKALPDAITIACEEPYYLAYLTKIFKSEIMKVEATTDIIGVEIGGAIKNVVAIAVGVLDGLQLGANARAVLITSALSQMQLIAKSLGAAEKTILGYSGLGDLILTCTDNQSRNRRFGLMLGQGETVQGALSKIGQVVEGFNNLKSAKHFLSRNHLNMPIVTAVYGLCYEGLSPLKMAQNLLYEK